MKLGSYTSEVLWSMYAGIVNLTLLMVIAKRVEEAEDS